VGSEGKVPTPQRIACLSLISKTGIYGVGCDLPGGPISWDLLPVEPDLAELRVRLQEAVAEYDAVAVEGITSAFRIGDQICRHSYVWHSLGLERLGTQVSDGSELQTPLERFLVRQAAEQLVDQIKDKRVLFFCGLNRYGSAEVLSRYTQHMLFGDMLYGFRLGIPIYRFNSFVAAAKRLARTVSRTPAHWFWPSTRRNPPIMPRFRRFFGWADVIVGGVSYFMRYDPKSLTGKIIFTNVHNDAEVEFFAARGARYLVSLTPVIDGTYVPLPVLEAALKLHAVQRTGDSLEDYYLGQIQRLALKPHIIDLAPEGSEDYALVGLPVRPAPVAEPVEQVELTPQTEVGKFCFVIHPLSFDHIARLRMVRALKHFVPQRLIEDAAAQMPPWPVGVIRNVISATGARAEGLLYAVPMTSKAILRFPPAFLYKRLLQVAEDAALHGCRLMGLGAYTSVAGDAGLTVSKSAPIGVTSGNSYTVAVTLQTLESAARRCGIDMARAKLLIIGATGSIGSICARMTAGQVAELCLVSPRPEKLLAFAQQLELEYPRLRDRVRLSRRARDFLPQADLIITTTSSVDPVVDVGELKPGCLVLDVARPPDIKPAAAARRDDVLVIESGEVRLPDAAEITFDIGLPPGTVYACLAETLLLALDQRFGHFTLGRDIDPWKVKLISAIAAKHGLQLADVHSFGEPVPDGRFARLAEINAGRLH